MIDEKRGDQLFLVNLEARLKTARRVYWFLRYDIGNVWTSKSFDLQELTQGIGVKLGITTPLGPVELGYGWAERGKQKAYLNLGFDFCFLILKKILKKCRKKVAKLLYLA